MARELPDDEVLSGLGPPRASNEDSVQTADGGDQTETGKVGVWEKVGRKTALCSQPCFSPLSKGGMTIAQTTRFRPQEQGALATAEVTIFASGHNEDALIDKFCLDLDSVQRIRDAVA